MSERDREIIGLIVELCGTCSEILDSIGGDYQTLKENKIYSYSCGMCVLQIGEMSSRLSEEFRKKHDDIPWRLIKDTRNFYVHNYFSIDMEVLWSTITESLPDLKTKCERILSEQAG